MADPSTNTEMVRVPILGENGRISDDYVPESIPQAVTAVEQAAEAAASSANEALQKAAAAEKSASSASSSAEQAKSYANNANTYMTAAESHAESAATDASAASKSATDAAASAEQASQSASSLGTAVTDAQSAATAAKESAAQAATSESSATSAATAAESSASAASSSASAAAGSASDASGSATAAASSATAAANSAQTATEKADSVLDHYIESAQATTLAAGEQATASVVDNVLTIGVPKGEKGDTGTGIPDGGSAGQVMKKTADGTEWAYDTGAVYNSEEGLQEMAEDGTNDPIYNFGITQGGMSASMSVMGDSPEVAADYSAASVSYRNAIGADADGPYVDLNLTGKTGGATKYRYVDDPSQFATADGIPTAKAVASAIGGGNVLTGTLGPAPILSADDAYATTPRKLTVYGETRQNLWVNPSGTSNGVTVTSNGDGSMTLSGTATSAASVSSADSYIIKPSTAYTLSMNAALTGASFVVTEYDAAGSQLAQHNVSSTSAASFTSSASVARCVMSLSVQSEQAVSGTYRVMLNEGSEAQPWCPPGLNSVDELSIVTAGKNLLDISTWTKVGGNGQLTVQPDGSWKCDRYGTAAASGFVSPILPPGSYRANVSDFTEGAQVGLACSVAQSFFTWNKIWSGYGCAYLATNVSNFTFVSSVPFRIGIVINSARYGEEIQPTIYVYNPQLELGSTATAYEPPAVTTTPIDLDGHTLCSLPDGTCDELTIDATGAVTLTKLCGLAAIDGDATYNTSVLTDNIQVNANKSSIALSKPPYDNTRPEKFPTSNWNAKLGQLVSSGSHCVSTYIPKELADTTDKAIDFVRGHEPYSIVYALATPQTIPLPAVTLPTLPAPTVNVYADAESSVTGYAMGPDAGMEYERDISMVIADLEAKVSELTVNQAIS